MGKLKLLSERRKIKSTLNKRWGAHFKIIDKHCPMGMIDYWMTCHDRVFGSFRFSLNCFSTPESLVSNIQAMMRQMGAKMNIQAPLPFLRTFLVSSLKLASEMLLRDRNRAQKTLNL